MDCRLPGVRVSAPPWPTQSIVADVLIGVEDALEVREEIIEGEHRDNHRGSLGPMIKESEQVRLDEGVLLDQIRVR